MRRTYYITGISITAAVAAVAVLWFSSPNGPDFEQPAVIIDDEGIAHPADIVRFRDHWVVAQLYDNRLAFFDDLALRNLDYFDPEDIDERFKSPHFLAVTPRDTLLISNGWGNSIVEIEDLKGGGWKEFSGIDRKFSAPHGICVDHAGWIYVADSLNSRIVRFRDMTGKNWQVFRDRDKVVSYVRELVCRNDEVWAANSYENRPGLNPGQGSNVLRIRDFESGRAEIVLRVPDANMTGVQPLGNDRILAGLWGNRRQLALFDADGRLAARFPGQPAGTPYGMYLERRNGEVIVTYPGDISDEARQNKGGIALYR